MKKPKISFDKAAILEWLTAHVEKGVFGLFILLFLLFCMGVLKQKPYDKRPDDFKQAATRVGSKVRDSVFDPVADVPPVKPLPKAENVPEHVWVTREVWNRPVFDVKKRRPEPKFLALQDVRVSTGYGAVPVREANATPGAPAAASPAAAPAAPPASRGGGLRGVASAGAAPIASGDAGPPPDSRLGGPLSAASSGPVKGKQWAVITGLVPWNNQVKEYRAAFRDARHTRPDDFQPSYASYEVERAEVAPGSAGNEELKWVPVNVKQSIAEEASFAEFGLDPVDPAFIDPAVCQRLPRVLGKEHDKSVGHPKLPQTAPKGAVPGGGMQRTLAPPPGGGGLRGNVGGLRNAGAAAMGDGPATGAPVDTGPKIENKLFRFFDYSVQPGATYRYRVRLVLNNPNYNVGVQYLADAQFAKGATRPAPWSDASTETTIPRGSSLLAGGIKKASGLNEQKMEVVVRMWEPKEAVDAAQVVELTRGQVANFPPKKVQIDERTDKEIAFQTDTLVVDMTGGDTLVGVRARAPGQMLVLEPNGQLAVRSELTDLELYEPTRRRIKELEEAAKPAPVVDTSAEEDRPKKRDKKNADGGISGLEPPATGKSLRARATQ